MLVEQPGQKIVTRPGRSVQLKTGMPFILVRSFPQCIADGHAHIENGACAPLPLLWDKSWLIRGKTRKQIDDSSTKGWKGTLFSLLKGEAGSVQVMSTFNIGGRAVDDNENTFAPETLIGSSELYGSPSGEAKIRDFYSFLVIQMMDMEYAHIAGLYGQTIYHENELTWYYYKRQFGNMEESKGKKVPLPGENQLTFVKFRKQLRETVEAAKANPLKLFPMYFYAPQRWNYTQKADFNEKLYSGPWNFPFSQVTSLNNNGIFLGFKMYTPLGSQPLDPRLPYLHDSTRDGDCFYARCEREGIPIMAHCSPGGMTTHELRFFMEHDSGHSLYEMRSDQSGSDSDATRVTIDSKDTVISYFYDTYVHPKAWRKVLQKYPKMKLCLAHFGGEEFKKGLRSTWVTEILALTEEYDNVYTDFSCWNMDDCKETLHELLISVKYAHIRRKLLFGTDWYMTLVALGGKGYKRFCEDAWDAFMEIPDGKERWIDCTFINPFTFYGLYDKNPKSGKRKLDCIAEALDKAMCDRTKLQDNLDFFNRLEKRYNTLLEQRSSGKGG